MGDGGQAHQRKIIAVLTDFGEESFYVGALKGAIYAVAPSVTVVDITHDISPHGITEGSFVLARVFEVFPEGTVFLAVVDPGVGGARRNLIFKVKGRYLVTPDNGLVSDVSQDLGVEGCYEISERYLSGIRGHHGFGRTFCGRDVFAPVAAALAKGVGHDNLGWRREDFVVCPLPPIEVGNRFVKGYGRYIDRFGNIVTNISGLHIKRAFDDLPLDRVEGYIQGRLVGGVREFYSQVSPGEPLMVLNSWNLVEISVNLGRASGIFPCSDPKEIALELKSSSGEAP